MNEEYTKYNELVFHYYNAITGRLYGVTKEEIEEYIRKHDK